MRQVLPFVAQESFFALKDGTAINLFVRDFERLSVDIDLVYLPLEDRMTSLSGISNTLSIGYSFRRANLRYAVSGFLRASCAEIAHQKRAGILRLPIKQA
ncbi:MAG: nucleotidyl transferase AbiEii/AbiGii toxin family protein [Verrucomicrobiota bacterium]